MNSTVEKAVSEKPSRRNWARLARKKHTKQDYDDRASLYRPRYVRAAALLVANGASDADLADFFGISRDTLKWWQSRHPAFGAAVRGAKEALTPIVERNLALKAIGWEQESEKVFYDGARGEVIRVQTREQLPPDTRAAERWLQAKGGPEWQPAAQRIDHRVVVRSMSDEELARVISDASALLSDASGEAPESGAGEGESE